MSVNLIESIQKALGYPELQKIDPNTQDVKHESSSQGHGNLAQAAIPAVLTGLYRYGNTERGAEHILRGERASDWLSIFFGDKKQEAIEKVATYSNDQGESAGQAMEEIADQAVVLIRENVPSSASFSDVKSFIAQQRSNILVYLPAELQLGSLVNDNTLDDQTNKMEGPMSNNMHFFEKLFSGSTTEKNEAPDPED